MMDHQGINVSKRNYPQINLSEVLLSIIHASAQSLLKNYILVVTHCIATIADHIGPPPQMFSLLIADT